jgi:hypothetical protein
MNKELVMVLLPGISWILFALGGTQISSSIQGQKWIRRWVLPAAYFIACMFFMSWWLALLTAVQAIVVYHLGYGEQIPLERKFAIGCGYASIGAFIGLSWWNAITVLGFITLFILSNTKLTQNVFVWKICEGFFGLLVGIQLAYILMER